MMSSFAHYLCTQFAVLERQQENICKHQHSQVLKDIPLSTPYRRISGTVRFFRCLEMVTPPAGLYKKNLSSEEFKEILKVASLSITKASPQRTGQAGS